MLLLSFLTAEPRPLASRTALLYGGAIGVMGLGMIISVLKKIYSIDCLYFTWSGYWWYTTKNLQDQRDMYNKGRHVSASTTIERAIDSKNAPRSIPMDKMPNMNLAVCVNIFITLICLSLFFCSANLFAFFVSFFCFVQSDVLAVISY